jgi:hypothetical protein
MGHRTRPEAAGGCLSGAAREAKIRSDLIDQQLEEAQREHARDAKVLVLGINLILFLSNKVPQFA